VRGPEREDSPTLRLLAEVERQRSKKPRSTSGSRLARTARKQAEAGARSLAVGSCSVAPLLAAQAAMARAEADPSTKIYELAEARRDLHALQASFASTCIRAKPAPRGMR